MGIYIPIQIQDREDGSYEGSFPFDRSYHVDGTRAQVIEKLYKAASGYLQNTKNREFLESLNPYHEGDYDFIKVDLFSRSEHFFFSTIAFLAALFGFALIFTIGTWCVLSIVPAWNIPADAKAFAGFDKTVITLGVFKIIIFMFFWNLFYYKVYPGLINLYGTLLLLQSGVRVFHLSLVSSICNLFQSKPYRYEPVNNNADQ
jgi:hypothetical protein